MLYAQRGKTLLRGVAPGDWQGEGKEAALADFNVGVNGLRQGIDRQWILPFRGSGYYKCSDFHLCMTTP